jgi:hypothetical protein
MVGIAGGFIDFKAVITTKAAAGNVQITHDQPPIS